MKKIIKLILIVIVLLSFVSRVNVYAETPTLQEIVTKFNDCEIVKSFLPNTTFVATTQNNTITINVTGNNMTLTYNYTLNDTILTTDLTGDDVELLSGSITSAILADCIGQLHGYASEEVYQTLFSEESRNYTVANEGFENKKIDDNHYQVKIDISKKIPVIDMSKIYVEVSDLEKDRQYIEDGFLQGVKGNIIYNKNGNEESATIIIAEKNNLTESAYKSALSFIEVLFNSKKAVDYFKMNCPDFSQSKRNFTGITVEVNSALTESEQRIIPSEGTYRYVKIIIDREMVKAAMNSATALRDTQTTQSVAVPDTGKNKPIYLLIMGVSFIVSGIALFLLITDRKKQIIQVEEVSKNE